MSETMSLEVQPRQETGKNANRRSRAQGKIPAVVYGGDADCVVFLQTIEHVQDPGAVLDSIREQIGPGGVAYVSTPNVLTLAPKGADRSGNPWHVREYRPEEYLALCERHFASVDLLGLFHARKLRAHQVAIERLGWDPDGIKVQLPDNSWQYNYEYAYLPGVTVLPTSTWPEDQWTHIRGDWWFHRSHDD